MPHDGVVAEVEVVCDCKVLGTSWQNSLLAAWYALANNLSGKVLMMIVWFQEMEQCRRLVETAAQATDEDAYGKGLVVRVEEARGLRGARIRFAASPNT